MLRNRLSPKTSSSYKPFALTAALWLAIACGGQAIPIGGEPASSDGTTSSPSGTTRDTNDATTTPTGGTGGGQAGGGGNTGSGQTPPGVQCAEYPACDATKPCESGDCVAFAECGTPLCIPADEACRLSCPANADCAILESYPLKIACTGKVPAIPDNACERAGGRCLPEDQSAPPTYTVGNFACGEEDEQCWVPVPTGPVDPVGGVSCTNRQVCDVDTMCPSGQTCLAFPEIERALCVEMEDACRLSCPDVASCVILDSYPGQLDCPDRIDATCERGGGVTGDAGVGDAGGPVGVTCDDHETCDALAPCEEGNCIKVPGCDQPLCIDANVACEQACGEVECRIAESYPEQLFCFTDDDFGDDPDQPVSSNDAGAGFGGGAETDAAAL